MQGARRHVDHLYTGKAKYCRETVFSYRRRWPCILSHQRRHQYRDGLAVPIERGVARKTWSSVSTIPRLPGTGILNEASRGEGGG